MPLTLLTPPAEPLALADAKAWLRVDGTEDDVLITALTRAARMAVEAASGQLIGPQAWRWTLDAWPPDRTFALPLSPSRGISAARVLSATRVATAVALSDFQQDLASDPPRITVLRSLQAPGLATGGIELDLLAGHASVAAVPETLRHAVRLVLARLYENRGDSAGDGADALPEAVHALIAPHRRRRLA